MENKRRCKYIVLEGTEGSGKTTHCKKLAEYLRAKGFKVLESKEPGSPHVPLTMELRSIMLDAKYEPQITPLARELVSQATRSIHIDKVIIPALQECDYIIQDRGILSSFAYGHVCGNSHLLLAQLASEVCRSVKCDWHDLYDKIVYLKNDAAKGLELAKQTKQEFAAGDAMEIKGKEFMLKVAKDMDQMVHAFPHCIINVEGKTVDENFNEILRNIDLGD
jgi:dTMP kinase